jgi:hypothetical protein
MKKSFLRTRLSKKEIFDSGLAAILLMLLLAYWLKIDNLFAFCIPAVLILMIYPRIYYPFAVVWLTFAGIMGEIMSTILLSLVFFFLVCHVGMARRLLGKDSLKIRDFKKSGVSVFTLRNIRFTSKDIEKPY